MPELARFYGIIIRMFMEPNVQHHTPHFHAYYQDEVGVFSISPFELISGLFSRRLRRFMEAWAELHEAELMNDWSLLQPGKKPLSIEPLK
jgi:hypothetical protein